MAQPSQPLISSPVVPTIRPDAPTSAEGTLSGHEVRRLDESPNLQIGLVAISSLALLSLIGAACSYGFIASSIALFSSGVIVIGALFYTCLALDDVDDDFLPALPPPVTSPAVASPEREAVSSDRPNYFYPITLSDALKARIESLERVCPVQPISPSLVSEMQKGGTFGQAVGDAIGLLTEFSTKAEAQEMIAGLPLEYDSKHRVGTDGKLGFKNGYNWNHINRFVDNGWTDDTDQFLSAIRAEYLFNHQDSTSSPQTEMQLFANELLAWRSSGLKERGLFKGRKEHYCMGLGALVGAVIDNRHFSTLPVEAARFTWCKKKSIFQRPAANGAIMRTAWIGLAFYTSLSTVIEKTLKYCAVTHADPRCAASCVALTVAIALILRGYKDINLIIKEAKNCAIETLHQEMLLAAKNGMLSKDEKENWHNIYIKFSEELDDHLNGSLDFLDLDEGWNDTARPNRIGYTYKCLGAAFWCLRRMQELKDSGITDKHVLFRKPMEELIGEAGDADTNGAVAGALLGAYLGFETIPESWTRPIADVEVLNQATDFIGAMQKRS